MRALTLLLILPALAGCTSAAQAISGSATSGAPTAPPHLVAHSCAGTTLNDNPLLHPGETVLLTVRGFGADAAVQVRLVGLPTEAEQPRADATGVLNLPYVVPRNISEGQHLLTLSGPGPQDAGSATGGNITVEIPNTGLFHFAVTARQRVTASTVPCQTSRIQ